MTPTTVAEDKRTSAIGRIHAGDTRWRVLVETWPQDGAYHGRLRFEADNIAWAGPRESAAVLRGDTREDVLLRVHDLPVDRLRRVLHSLA